MKYSKIITYDPCNSYGFSVTIWVSGCTHNCPGCFNSELWDFNYGKKFTKNTLQKLIKAMDNEHISSLVISGGDPLHPNNIETVIHICQQVKNKLPDKEIIIYTGYKIEELLEELSEKRRKELFCNIDYLIDGKFDRTRRTKDSQLRGSTNQRCFAFKNHICSDITKEYFGEEEL